MDQCQAQDTTTETKPECTHTHKHTHRFRGTQVTSLCVLVSLGSLPFQVVLNKC